MTNTKKRFISMIQSVLCVFSLSGCTDDSVSQIDNISEQSNINFETEDIVVRTTTTPIITSQAATNTTTNTTTTTATTTTTTVTTATTTTTTTTVVTTTTTTTTPTSTSTTPSTAVSSTQTWWVPASQSEIVTTTAVYTEPATENIQPLPEYLQSVVDYYKSAYPGMHIGVGLFSLDGKKGYVYNGDEEISGGCTVKAAFALFVLKTCQDQKINIWSEELEYKYGMKNNGSGQIKYADYGTKYTIAQLLSLLLGISDNTAYNILAQKFTLTEFQKFLNSIDGQKLKGFQYGNASVNQRLNEWVAILEYINAGELYSQSLYNFMHNTQGSYIINGMSGYHDYLHKSGSSSGTFYNSASDVAVVDNSYIAIVMTEDYVTGYCRQNVAKGWGTYVEKYVTSIGGPQNLF